MHRISTTSITALFGMTLLATTAFTGCFWLAHPRSCNDIPVGAIPRPAGTYACQWVHAEMARADLDNFVIYQYEWAADGTGLTPFGQEHLAALAPRLCESPYPVVIEPSADDRVNAARKLAVLSALANCHVEVSSDRVILGGSEAEGLYGEEAPGIAATMLASRRGGQAVGAGFGATEAGTFSASQTGTFSAVPAALGGAPSTGVGVGVY